MTSPDDSTVPHWRSRLTWALLIPLLIVVVVVDFNLLHQHYVVDTVMPPLQNQRDTAGAPTYVLVPLQLEQPADEADFFSKIGDFTGGAAGALLSFAGLILLLQTIDDQRRELREMRRIHEEQQFEATFFQALNGHNELVKHLESHDGHKFVNGKKCLQHLYEIFEQICEKEQSVEKIQEFYNQFSHDHRLVIKQFNQSIEQLIWFAYHANDVDKGVKKNLLGFVSAQLTYYEEFFLLLHLIVDPKLARIKKLVVDYQLFDCQPDRPFQALSQIPPFKP